MITKDYDFPLKENEIAIIVDAGINEKEFKDFIEREFVEQTPSIVENKYQYFSCIKPDGEDKYMITSYTKDDFIIAESEEFIHICETEDILQDCHPYETLLRIKFQDWYCELNEVEESPNSIVYCGTVHNWKLQTN